MCFFLICLILQDFLDGLLLGRLFAFLCAGCGFPYPVADVPQLLQILLYLGQRYFHLCDFFQKCFLLLLQFLLSAVLIVRVLGKVGSGFLIPVRDKDGLIQGLKIRLDDGISGRKYRWFSSRGLPDGTRSYSWIHVTGNTGSHTAYLTEGPLKGDAASYLMDDALFVCLGGVNAVKGLSETLVSLGVREVIEAMGTKYGVVKTKVEGRGWSGWCKLPYLTYLEE